MNKVVVMVQFKQDLDITKAEETTEMKDTDDGEQQQLNRRKSKNLYFSRVKRKAVCEDRGGHRS